MSDDGAWASDLEMPQAAAPHGLAGLASTVRDHARALACSGESYLVDTLRLVARRVSELRHRLEAATLSRKELMALHSRLEGLRAQLDRLSPLRPAMLTSLRDRVERIVPISPVLLAIVSILAFFIGLALALAPKRLRRRPKYGGSITVFYDVENGPIPTKELMLAIRRLALTLGDRLDRLYCYCELGGSPRALSMRRTLLECGATIIDTPHNGVKETADKVMIFDLADCVARRRADVILLVTDDADFIIPIARVQQSGIPIVRAGFRREVAEIVRSDRSFVWENGAFDEIIDAPFRLRQDKSRFTRFGRKRDRPLLVPSMSAPAIAREPISAPTDATTPPPPTYSHAETLLLKHCRPYLLLLSLFYGPHPREAVLLESAVIEIGWPGRPDNVNLKKLSGAKTFKAWCSGATKLGLLSVTQGPAKGIVKGPDADFVWDNVNPDWKSALPPLLHLAAAGNKAVKAAQQREEAAVRKSPRIKAFRPPSEASSTASASTSTNIHSTPPSSAASTPLRSSSVSPSPAAKSLAADSPSFIPRFLRTLSGLSPPEADPVTPRAVSPPSSPSPAAAAPSPPAIPSPLPPRQNLQRTTSVPVLRSAYAASTPGRGLPSQIALMSPGVGLRLRLFSEAANSPLSRPAWAERNASLLVDDDDVE